ncbi:hypothetical protein PF010_g23810 [Phytophthora fragariae]|uniref:RxLR effector protein n=1 Tax=Phytophthora fragariae TaxID=53985 RepID=A0A6G0K537_9STRA|nr:hypothetical protein PF010_g23810 [Phytophthora fragariae]
MSLLWLMGLALLAFVVPLDAETPATLSVSDFSTWAGVHTAIETGISPTRFLRTGAVVDDDIDDDGEERAGLSVPFAEKAKTFFSSSKVTAEHLQKWLAEEKPVDTVSLACVSIRSEHGCCTAPSSPIGSSTSTI